MLTIAKVRLWSMIFPGETLRVLKEKEIVSREGRSYEAASALLEGIKSEREKSVAEKSGGKYPRLRRKLTAGKR